MVFEIEFRAAPASIRVNPHLGSDQSNSYGATLHDMTSKVDAGTIRAQILFGVKPYLMPNFYLNRGMAVRCLFELWARNPTIL